MMAGCQEVILGVIIIIVKIMLKELRESQFLTQRELAEKSGVGVATIARIEKGKRRPTFRTIKRLAAVLGVEPSELAKRES
jgi:transcriptional regulator with XRE-family HTH domain